MKKSLITINQIIKDVERNLGNSKKLQELCEKLEETLSYMDDDLAYHFNLFLVEIYGTKLQQTTIAEKICREVMSDPRAHVKVEALLRLSYLYSIEGKYKNAQEEFKRVQAMVSKGQPELKMIAIHFLQRVMDSSRDSNILTGLKCEQKNDYEKALQYYNSEFDQEEIFGSDQNRYFTAKSIIRICSIFHKLSNKTDLKKCKDFLHRLQADTGDNEDGNFEDRFMERKKFFSIIVEFILDHEKRKATEFEQKLTMKKIIAIFKLKKALNVSGMKGSVCGEEMKKCLKDLEECRITSPNMLGEFVKKEYEICKKANIIASSMIKNVLASAFSDLQQEDEDEPPRYMRKKKSNLFGDSPTKRPSKEEPTKKSESEELEEKVKNFHGSFMYKINEHSSGHDKRYFHFNSQDLKKKRMKLFYTNKETKASDSDDFYEIKNIEDLAIGKKSKPLQRDECKSFEEDQCFSLHFKDSSKNFYVPNKELYEKWVAAFTIFMKYNPSIEKSTTNPVDIEKSKVTPSILIKSRSPMTKSKRVIIE